MSSDERARAMKVLGANVRFYREARGLTQAQLGQAAGYNGLSAKVTISRIEQSQVLPPIDKLWALADALDVRPHQLLDPKSCRPRA